ncbi:hypothetical protein VPH35_124123 [Triticum aestivum]
MALPARSLAMVRLLATGTPGRARRPRRFLPGTWPLCRPRFTAPPPGRRLPAPPRNGTSTLGPRHTCHPRLDLRTKAVILRCNSGGDLYPVGRPSSSSSRWFAGTVTIDLWHQRLGHPGRASSAALPLEFTKSTPHVCHACRVGKHIRLPFESSSSHSMFPFQLLHLDVWTSPIISISGYQYYLVILDDYTHYVWTFPLKHKSEILQILVEFFVYVQTQFQLPIFALQTDNGREFDNAGVRSLLARHGAHFRLTCPYTSQHNDKAERVLRTLNDGVRALLVHASMPARLWAEALSASTYLLNRRPCRSSSPRSPHELLLGVAPDYTLLRVFGCLCYPNLTATTRHKLDRRSTACMFLGYPPDHRGYRCFDPVTRRVFTSRHVVFHETVFPFARTSPDDTTPLPPPASSPPVLQVPLNVGRPEVPTPPPTSTTATRSSLDASSTRAASPPRSRSTAPVRSSSTGAASGSAAGGSASSAPST